MVDLELQLPAGGGHRDLATKEKTDLPERFYYQSW